MTDAPTEWMPRERWDALVRGEDCPLCAAIASDVDADEYGYTIVDLASGRLRLVPNQYVMGYCVFISAIHAREPYDLSPSQRAAFFEDMTRVGLALERVFASVKMNFEILGNAIPHLHCHIKPRYYGDPAPGQPIHPNTETVLLTPEAYAERVSRIRAALRAGA